YSQVTTIRKPDHEEGIEDCNIHHDYVEGVLPLLWKLFEYAAFGNQTAGNLLTGFGFYEPYWLVDFANACIVVHLVGGYQVYSQPVFAFLEGWLAKKYHNNFFINISYGIPIPVLQAFRVNLLSLCLRTAYVVSTIGIAMLFPYFNLVLGSTGLGARFELLALGYILSSRDVYYCARESWCLDKKVDYSSNI
ncbi:hypothetical protein IFM89_029339, partial [Coptis chinensis]